MEFRWIARSLKRDFSELLTLPSMSKLCAFTYEWRDNVLQHLHVIANDKSSFKPRLYFFHHATVLREMWLFEDSR